MCNSWWRTVDEVGSWLWVMYGVVIVGGDGCGVCVGVVERVVLTA